MRDDLDDAIAAEQHRNEVLAEAARTLQDFACEHFTERGPYDPRGAALWDAACYLVEQMGDGNWRGADV